VVLISTDNVPSLREWAGKLGVSYALASDFTTRSTAKAYGVLMEERGIASRTTFVIGKDGTIQHIDEGKAALDPTGALTACKRVRK
jgi:peroxiredoxin Q/BCP